MPYLKSMILSFDTGDNVYKAMANVHENLHAHIELPWLQQFKKALFRYDMILKLIRLH